MESAGDPVDELLQRAERLHSDFVAVADQLVVTADRLRQGLPPAGRVWERLSDVRRAYDELRDGAASFLGLPAGELPEGLLALTSELEAFRRSLEGVINPALEVVERAAVLVHSEVEDFGPLVDVKNEAAALANRLREERERCRDVAEAIVDGRHPFSHLLRLVEAGSRLSDRESGYSFEVVREAFGLEVAAAALRGRLRVQAAVPPGPEPPGGEPAGAVAGLPLTKVMPPAAEEPVAPDMAAAMGDTGVSPERVGLEEGVPEATSAAAGSTAVPAETMSEAETGPELPAEAVLARPSPAELAPCPAGFAEGCGLVWKLLLEDRVGLAFQLAKALHGCATDLPLPPVGLLRALSLAPHLQHPDGEIAAALGDVFAEIDGVGKHQAANLLLWAATVRPTLLAPSTGAGDLLRGVQPGEGLSALYQMAQLIVDKGTRLQGLTSHALKGAKAQVAWQAEMEQLVRQVEDWSDRAPRMTMLVPSATRVWQAWTRPGGPIHNMLYPVRTGQIDRVEEVKAWVERLATPAEFRKLVNETHQALIGQHKIKELQARAFRQLEGDTEAAVRFARRWVRLVEGRPQQGGYVPTQLEDLSRKLRHLYHQVLGELTTLEAAGSSDEMRAAVACARRMLENLHQLFDPEIPLVGEQAVRYVLGAELLLAPHVDITRTGSQRPVANPWSRL